MDISSSWKEPSNAPSSHTCYFIEDVRSGIILLMALPSSSSIAVFLGLRSLSAGLFMLSLYPRSSRAKEGADGKFDEARRANLARDEEVV